eukprot:CAMPEP_0183293790 /NCGR_PEP_ID=MMETSP0160_2-20130417/2348_1 /TAXON_ID=2839 ORGANISM="Odontella Sinensis, Strain Grunow 1884" /NCGR_SAMPLE_ID=MMETSP0160_2 /ASSEMBLY_ACC=CAM_ASM_000250 /LENGTH=229 /DNA_ID=CAMNT_0025454973 /DNA_START=73 /DNA_END=762 /DNA_ORIENTATION=+
MVRLSVSALALLALFGHAAAFAPNQVRASVPRSAVSLSASRDGDSLERRAGPAVAAVVSAALVAGLLSVPDAALASSSPDFGGTSTVLAGRSGGRAGGRAGSGGVGGRSAAYRGGGGSSRTVINRSTYIAPGPAIVAPPPVIGVSPFGYGFGYNPLGGFGLGYGLGAVGSTGDAIRDYRQEGEIQRTRVELEESRRREAEMEARLRMLEQGQMQLQTQQQVQQQMQMTK